MGQQEIGRLCLARSSSMTTPPWQGTGRMRHTAACKHGLSPPKRVLRPPSRAPGREAYRALQTRNCRRLAKRLLLGLLRASGTSVGSLLVGPTPNRVIGLASLA